VTEHRSVPILSEDGTVLVTEGIARDVTARIDDEQRLRASDARMRDLLSTIDLGALVLDSAGRIEFINPFLLRLLDRREDEVIGRDWIDVAVPEAERPALRAVFEAAIAGGTGAGQREDGVVTRRGDQRRLLWTSAIQHDLEGRVVGLAAIAHDVTEVRRSEAERARLAAAIEQSAESVVITDREARIEYVNRAFERISGYRAAEVVGGNPRILKSGIHSRTFYDAMWAALSNGLPWTADLVNRRKDGTLYHLSSVISPIRDADGSITGFVDVGRDVGYERELESRADSLTRERALITETLRRLPPGGDVETTAELFCRQVASLTDVVVAALIAFEVDGGVPLAYVGPDRPRSEPRRLSPQGSRYLREHAATGPWVAQWSDEPDHPYADVLERSGIDAIAYAPISSEGALIGVLLIGSAQPDAVTQLSGQLGALVDFADLAGALLGPRVGQHRQARRLRSEIEQVLADRAFSAVFQPIVDLRTGRTVGHEALTRFRDGVAPDRRFADAAAVGLGLELELATLEMAIDAARGRLSPSRWLHLNVSPELVLAKVKLDSLLAAALGRVVLEITEHAAVGDYRAFREAIAALGRPVDLAVDDAGAGFASLRHILELKPTFVKLDVSLVRGIDTDPAKQALVAGMRHFARTTCRRLIAEGIETAAEADALRQLNIRLGQGFLLGRPAPLPE
jgi:PAS domain S-box-containing protein